MRKFVYLSLFFAATFFVASCSSKNGDQAAATSADTTATESTESASADQDANYDIVLTGNDQMQFSATAFTVKAGQEVSLKFSNVGTLPKESMSHDVVILKAGSDVAKIGMATTKAGGIEKLTGADKDAVLVETKMLGPGESDVIKFTLPAAGEYPFFCSFPGHYGTMKGVITAE